MGGTQRKKYSDAVSQQAVSEQAQGLGNLQQRVHGTDQFNPCPFALCLSFQLPFSWFGLGLKLVPAVVCIKMATLGKSVMSKEGLPGHAGERMFC